MNAAKATARWVLSNKLRTVKMAILEELEELVHGIQNDTDARPHLRKFHQRIFHHLRDLQSWPTSPRINVATMRIKNILDILRSCLMETRKDKNHHTIENIPLTRIRIILKARQIS